MSTTPPSVLVTDLNPDDLPTFDLGDRVLFDRELVRVTRVDEHPDGTPSGVRKTWERHLVPCTRTGVVVGRRTLADGYLGGGWDEPVNIRAYAHGTAYLVAYDLHRRPVYVLPEDLTRAAVA